MRQLEALNPYERVVDRNVTVITNLSSETPQLSKMITNSCKPNGGHTRARCLTRTARVRSYRVTRIDSS